MNGFQVDFSQLTGPIKPMHSVNNGPDHKFSADQRISNLETYRAAGIPFARTHDASFFPNYGGEHTVDVHMIFPDFDADENDPANYDFDLTDDYMQVIALAGAKPFYRLGSKIEHTRKKYGTIPPKDFAKWARICEHIIRHYNEGWANGFEMGIEYWEIWNEPDLDPDDSIHKRCWGGTRKQFFEFYNIAARHLKGCFPHLMIGGPALAGDMQWAEEFLAQLEFAPDFFSWHIYARQPEEIAQKAAAVRQMLDRHGYTATQSILNEWNYVKGWEGDEWIYSLKTERGLKGAAFIAATMALCQNAPVDMLMYYDARPCAMNGLYEMGNSSRCLKGYYSVKMFGELYKIGTQAKTEAGGEIYGCAAAGENGCAAMFTRYADADEAPAAWTRVSLSGLAKGARVEWYITDGEGDMALVRQDIACADTLVTELPMKLFDICMVRILQN